MKAFYTILVLSLILSACKTRHVVTTKTVTTSSELLTNSVKKDSVKIDTGKVHTDIKTAKNVKDSVTVIITPDTGAIQTFHVDAGQSFGYTGKAKSIVFKKTVDDHSAIDESVQENKAEITSTSLTDTSSDRKQTQQIVKSKVTDSKPSYGWVPWLLAILAVIGIAGFITYKLKLV